MNPTPRVSQFRSTLRAIAPRLFAAALLFSAFPSQAKDPAPKKQEKPIPASCQKAAPALEKWKIPQEPVKEWFWDYLVGPRLGYSEKDWSGYELIDKCKIFEQFAKHADEAYNRFLSTMEKTNPKKVSEKEPKKREVELQARMKILKEHMVPILDDFGSSPPANTYYRGRLQTRATELNKELADIQRETAKDVEKAAKKQLEGEKASLKTVKKVEEKVKKNKGKIEEKDIKKIYGEGGKERKELKKAGGSPGTQTSGKVAVGQDKALKGTIGEAKTKYTGGPGKQVDGKAPPAPMTDEEKKFQRRMGKIEQIQKDEKTVEKPGFFGKLWNGIKENPAITSLAVGAVGAGIGAIAGGGKGALIGGLAGAGLGLGVSMVGRATEADETTKARQGQQALSRNDKELKKFGTEGKEAIEDWQKAEKSQNETQVKASEAAAKVAAKKQELEAKALEIKEKAADATPAEVAKMKRDQERLQREHKASIKEAVALQDKADAYGEQREKAYAGVQDWQKKFDARLDGLLDERQMIVNDLNKNQEVRSLRSELRELDRKKQEMPEQADQIEKKQADLRAQYRQRWEAGGAAGTDNSPGSAGDSGSQPMIVENPSNVLAGDPPPKREPRRRASQKMKAKPEPPHDPVYDAQSNWVYKGSTFDFSQEERGRWGGQTPAADSTAAEQRYGAAAVEYKSRPAKDPTADIRSNHLTHCARQSANADKCASSRWEQLKGALGAGACEDIQGADQKYWDNCGRALSGR